MKLRYRLFFLSLILVLAFAFPSVAVARSLSDDRVIFGGNFTLPAGETHEGSLMVFGGNVSLEEGSRVTQDVVVLGGNLTSEGEIDGSLISLGGNSTLGALARVGGDMIMIGGNLVRDPGAQIAGQIFTENDIPLRVALPRFRLPNLRPDSIFADVGFSLMSGLWFLFRVFLTAALAVVVVMLFPRPTERTAHAITTQPLIAGLIGILTAVVLPVILVVMAITLILIPVSLFGLLALFILGFFGWVALGYVLGERMMHTFKQTWAPPVAAGVGTFVLSFVSWMIDAVIPCVGWMVPWFVAFIGLGAVLMTRIGTQYYQQSGPMGSSASSSQEPLPPVLD